MTAAEKIGAPLGTRLDGSVALVTGAGRGIGRAAATALAALGSDVVLVSRTEADLRVVEREIGERYGVRAKSVVCDVADAHQVQRSLGDLDVDVLVNSAGTNVPGDFVDVPEEVYDQIMDVNVRGTFLVTQSIVRTMLAREASGAIVNVTSQMGHIGGPRRTVYCASKHAVEGLTKALAVELSPRGIRVNSVAPTYVETELTSPFLAEPAFRSWVLREVLLGRTGTVAEVAAAIAFLASPSASLITGTSLLVDGGWTAH